MKILFRGLFNENFVCLENEEGNVDDKNDENSTDVDDGEHNSLSE